MLNTETKRRIDTARDILVGKVPDPKTQVEQITFAMIYKFMDDMDQLSVRLGGNPSFFANGYEQYAWSKLMDRKISGADRLDLYVRALDQMAQNPHIPQLFRDVFKGAFLPYRDSETLNLFLKEMNGFTYAHSEDLGDAYEYLLSIFATQGKAGQFRTPRHIIDFIVDCVDPDLNDTVLDPACGTAGFLISAYKHILEKHADNPLTPDQKKRLTENFVGYDISPDMVRLSRVNMYLHQFPNPTIFEYDTLTTEDRWEDTFDVILANPPFMTPKGGIRPHKRFAVRANRSEVLFVDYIAEHLNVGGRAGVIVPEGIIFQSSNAYKALRKMLVEEGYLYAVVSLPAGIFNPYSNVKTSVLLMDKELAKVRDSILFVKVENDGYDLGAQRSPIDKNDLPEALEILREFKRKSNFDFDKSKIALLVKKERLALENDFNFSADRYNQNGITSKNWPMKNLGDLEKEKKLFLLRGRGISKKDIVKNGENKCIHYGEIYTLYEPIINTVFSSTDYEGDVFSVKGDVLVPSTTTADALGIAVARALNEDGIILGGDINIIRTENKVVESKFLSYLINYPPLKNVLATYAKGTNILHLSNDDIRKLEIPLPPLEVQQEIVEEIEGYQKVIDGARQVVENYKPVIHIDPDWPLVKLGEVCEVKGGKRIPKGMSFSNRKTNHPYIRVSDFEDYGISKGALKYIDENVFSQISSYTIESADVFISIAGTIGLVGRVPEDLDGANLTENAAKIVVHNKEQLDSQYLVFCLASDFIQKQIIRLTHSVGVPKLALYRIKSLLIPVAPIDQQIQLVKNLTEEKNFIQSNKILIDRFESKIADSIKRVWEEGSVCD